MVIEPVTQLAYLFSIAAGLVTCYYALKNFGKTKDSLRIASAFLLGISIAAYGFPLLFSSVEKLFFSALSAILVSIFWSVYTYRLMGNRKTAHILVSLTPVVALSFLFGIKGLVFCAIVAAGYIIGYNRLYRRITDELVLPISAINIAFILWMFELFASVSGMGCADDALACALLSLAHRTLLLYGGIKVSVFLGTHKMDDLVAKTALKASFKI